MSELNEMCASIEVFLQEADADAAEAQIHLLCIQEAIQHLRELAELQPPQEHDLAMRKLIELRGRVEAQEQHLCARPQPQAWYQGERGAWTLAIDEDLLLDLMELRFTDKDIGTLLSCSRSTLKRRRAQMGITKRQQDDISHEQLCDLVREIRHKGAGQEGERAIEGALRSQKIKVSRARLRLAVQETDPLRQHLFRRQPVQRRVYNVPFRWTTSKYMALFAKMEEEEYFDANNAVDLWTLHFVFLPLLNHALQHFQQLWNNHPMRTPGLKGKSPNQLYAQGIVEAERAGWAILHGDGENVGPGAAIRNFTDYGVERNYPERERRVNDPHVFIPALAAEIPPILSDGEVQAELRRRLGSVWPPPADDGVALFRRALVLVKVLLQSPLATSYVN
ncbi:hypothetical protein OC835_000685 [Tilletia horrida]|nr:hypothetical protein OC835_000685 [Tilletia horrida]